VAGALPSSSPNNFVVVAEEAVTSELLSPKNKEKYRENSAE
jgi:hypothetical protein